ncbi:MAG: UDP-N-acetylmuramate--L-alanine ligase [Anaerolineae bacterium]
MLRAHSSRHMDPEQTAALDGKRGKTSASALGVAKAGRGEASSINLAGQRIHFVGIAGAALSGLAHICLAAGARVSGSDLASSPATERLQQAGAIIYTGHAAKQVAGATLVVISSAVPADNVEVTAARARGVPVLKRHEFVGQLMQDHSGVGVAGTHGKTTTTSMIALILEDAGLDPTLLVGGEMRDLGLSAKRGSGPHFVVEADEYDRAFLSMPCEVAVVTNIEADHPDIYPTLQDMVDAYRQFIRQVPLGGTIIANWDDPQVRELVKSLRSKSSPIIVTYGVAHSGQWWASELAANERGGWDFTVWRLGRNLGRFSLGVPGLHNVSNALAALAATERLGVSLDRARAALSRFNGAARRFEIKGQRDGVTIVDDYAHHPSEIRATLAAARQRFPGRKVWAVFQPHTFSRTATLMDEFARAFRDADHVLITDIFAARETNTLGVSAQDLARRMSHPDARYIGELTAAAAVVAREARGDDVVLTLGAGDVYRVGDLLLSNG